MKVSVIGTGVYSLALSLHIARNNHEVVMWSENVDLVKNFNKSHNLKAITDKKIPANIKVTNDLEETLKNTDLILMGTTAKYVRQMCLTMKKNYDTKTPICIASKGIENDTCAFLSDIVRDILKSKHIAVISGPTFAVDLINEEPCALSLATTTKKTEKAVKSALESKILKLRTNHDLNGTEICGSIKNVIAISSGILEGLGYNESTRAFLLTESLHDIKELLYKLECNPKTVLSFAGVGDLLLTCSSNKSRNYQFGVLLGSKKKEKQIEEFLHNNTVEGYYTLLSIKELTKNRKIKMPIINIIYDIVINKKEPEILSEFLINKE